MSLIDDKLALYYRKGDMERANFIKNLRKKTLDSQIRRIQQNDKSVLREIVLPKWMNWDLLFDWAVNQKVSRGDKKCAFCLAENNFGVDFNGKFICERCFMELKKL